MSSLVADTNRLHNIPPVYEQSLESGLLLTCLHSMASLALVQPKKEENEISWRGGQLRMIRRRERAFGRRSLREWWTWRCLGWIKAGEGW